MPTAKKVLQKAASYIGLKGDHNIFNKWYWVDYTKKYSYDPGTAWCAAFVSYCLHETGMKCSYSASAAGVATQFERIPVYKENTVQPGDIVVFNWDGRTDTGWCDHVGFVEWSTIGQDGLFGTIEGNTGNAAEGQVLRVTRNNESNYFTAFYRPEYSADSATSEPEKTTPKPSSKKALDIYGIDVSSNQPSTITRDVANDFALVKMSGNPQSYSWNFVNPSAKEQADYAYKKHARVGLYHFTWGKDPVTEANFFLSNVEKIGYLGKAALVIDYEAEAIELGRNWLKKLADRIKSKTGQDPLIYASGSVIVAQKLFDLGYPIWCANYYRGYEPIHGYDTSGMKIYPGCENSLMWQFTSQGFLDGYSGPLDLDKFLGSEDDWARLLNGKAPDRTDPAPSPAPTPSGDPVVKTAQKWLKSNRYFNGKVDGVYGPITRAATVKAVQKVLGVTADGSVGPITLGAFKKKSPVRKNAKGAIVKAMQVALMVHGFDTGSIDGIFGPKTEKAVKAFQKANGIEQDGIIGPITFKRLF